MPNWKKVIVSGSNATLNNLLVDGNVTASIFSGSQFTGSFYGDGANLSGIVVDDGLPNNSWDFNIPDTTPINDFQTASVVYLIDFNNLPLVGTEAGKIGWFGDTSGQTQLIPANNGLYIVASDTTVGYITSNGYSGSIVGIGNVTNFSSSVDSRLSSITSPGIVSGSSQIIQLGFLQTASADFIQFNTGSTTPGAVGNLVWNTVDGTLNLGMGYSSSSLQLGQELYNPPVVNKSGADMTDGTLVMIVPGSPVQGQRVAVQPLISDGTYPADYIVGVLTSDLANNATGFATWFGYVRNINKTHLLPGGETWAEGDVLYPNPTLAGYMTNVQPTAPNLKSTIAVVTAINGNNVTLMVRPSLRGKLDTLHNVTTTSTTHGDLLMITGSNGIWTNSKQLSGSYAITGSLTTKGSQTISGSLTVTGSVAGNVIALSVASGTASIDFRAGTFFTLTIPSSSITHITASNMQPGLTANLILTQQATTGSVRWDSAFKFPSGSFNTGSASGSAVDIVSMMMVNNTTIYSVGAKQIQ